MTQPPSPKPKKSIYWLILFAAVVVVGVGVWYLLTKDDKGSEGNIANANGAKNNNISVTSDQETTFTFANLIVHYPATWTSQKINVSDSCMGLVSPELKRYNEQWRQQHPDVTSTDAVVTNDVTICNAGKLSGTIETASKKVLDNSGADIINGPKHDTPFQGAISYSLSQLSNYEEIYFARHGEIVRAILQELSYQNSQVNKAEIKTILENIE